MYNYETVKRWAQEVVAEKGLDFHYKKPMAGEGCKYVHQDVETGVVSPGCLIGHMLIGQDLISMPEVWSTESHGYGSGQRFNGLSIYKLITAGMDNVGPLAGVSFSQKAEEYMSSLQGYQDCGDEWGLALQRAQLYIDGYEGSFSDTLPSV